MIKELSVLCGVLGRRETIKYAAIALGATALAPLTGCSGGKAALGEFAAGEWRVSIPSKKKWPETTVSVSKDGTWEVVQKEERGEESSSGTWSLSGTTLTVTETPDNADDALLLREGDETSGTAASIPEEVDEEKTPSSFQWSYGRGQASIPVSWDKKSRTLTLTGADAGKREMPIIITRA